MKQIVISIPSYTGQIPLRVMSRLIQLDKPDGFKINFSYVERAFIDKARNGLVENALINDNDYIFFTDDDQIPDKDILVKMVELDKDIVGCPIPNRRGKHELAIYDLEGNRMNEVKETMEVGAVGMGGTLIKRDVLEDMMVSYTFPFEFEISDGVEYSEDINFCRRAKKLGYEVWVHSDVKSMHIGDPQVYYYDKGGYKCTKIA